MKRKIGRSKSSFGKVKVFLEVTATLLLIAVFFSSVAFAKPDKFNTLVQTRYGLIKGFNDLGFNNLYDTLAWKSIPYAKPPTPENDLRWRAPEDPEPWDGIRDGTQSCQPCTQMATGGPIGGEDCLYLNIWRPNNDKQKLPVYVFIHGGSNYSGDLSIYPGWALAHKSDVVAVFIQYRLGPLGWLTHPALETGNSLEDSGNFGTLDHLQALKWIKENIAAFGGNPDNVLITGESAGGHNVMNLVISPLARGLFHGAMSESGGMHPVTKNDPLDKNNSYTKRTLPLLSKLLSFDGRLKVPDMDGDGDVDNDDVEIYLRSQGANRLIYAYSLAGQVAAAAHKDGHVIPGGYIDIINTGNYNKVPIILGSNQDEMKLYQPLYSGWAKYFGAPSGLYTWNDLNKVAGVIPNPQNLTIDQVLPGTLLDPNYDKNVYEAIADFGSLNWRYNFVDSIARALAEQQNKVYAYLFKWDGVDPYKFVYGAAHATEIPFFYGYPTDIFGGIAFNPINDTPGRQALSNAMMNYLAKFARSGNPNGSGLPVWQPWFNNAGKSKAIVFDANTTSPELGMTSEEITSANVEAAYQAARAVAPLLTYYVFNWYPWY
jgi:para-nitrobenzyl esterase